MRIHTRNCLIAAGAIAWSILLGGCEDKKQTTAPAKQRASETQSETSKDSPTATTERDRKSEGQAKTVLDSEKGLETESGSERDSPETR